MRVDERVAAHFNAGEHRCTGRSDPDVEVLPADDADQSPALEDDH